MQLRLIKDTTTKMLIQRTTFGQQNPHIGNGNQIFG